MKRKIRVYYKSTWNEFQFICENVLSNGIDFVYPVKNYLLIDNGINYIAYFEY